MKVIRRRARRSDLNTEVRELRARLERLEAEPHAAPHASALVGSEPAQHDAALSRRRFVTTAGAIAAGGVAGAVLGTGTASATTGNMRFGQTNNAGSAQTFLTSTANRTLFVTNTASNGTGLDATTTATGANAAGVRGVAYGATGATFGVRGLAASTTNGAAGVAGATTGATGVTYGVRGGNASTSGGAAGVRGDATAATGATFGVQGFNASSTFGAAGVRGDATAATGATAGVKATNSSSSGGAAGVQGVARGGAGDTFGVDGFNQSSSTGAAGVRGFAVGGTGVLGASGSGVGLSGQGGRAALRLVPKASVGAPTSGAHDAGELVVDSVGSLFLCKIAGTPGTWTQLNDQAIVVAN